MTPVSIRLLELRSRGFLGGIALHNGAHAFSFEDGLLAMPIDRLWASL